jgi:hypothetical protein
LITIAQSKIDKSWLAKKHVFGSSVGCRGGGCQTLVFVLGVLAYVENTCFLKLYVG